MPIRWYIRPDKRNSSAAQRSAIAKFEPGVKEPLIYEEAERGRGIGYPVRDEWASHFRPSDVLGVADFHRLASTAVDLQIALKATIGKGAVIVEASSGRRTDKPGDLSDMILEATAFYARRGLTHKEIMKLSAAGTAASPVTKEKKGRMPIIDARIIWRNPMLSVEEAVAKINSDRRYKVMWTQSHAYRKLGKRDMGAGRRAADHRHRTLLSAATSGIGVIYFMRAGGKGPVKIGWSFDLAKRLKVLQTGNHGRLELVATVPGNETAEGEMHRRFSQYRIKGEWFRVEGDLKRYLEKLTKK